MPATRQSFPPDEATMAFQAEVQGRTGVWLSGQRARILQLLLRPHGATKTLIDAEEWPNDEGDASTYARINVVVARLRKLLAEHIVIETFYGGGYRARWRHYDAPSKTEKLYEKAHYRRTS